MNSWKLFGLSVCRHKVCSYLKLKQGFSNSYSNSQACVYGLSQSISSVVREI